MQWWRLFWKVSRQLVLLGWGVGVAACALDEGETAGEEAKPTAQLVGRVAALPSEGGFVLIQSYGAWSVPEGSTLFSRGPEGRVANLLLTGERLNQFVAADVRSGQVAVGDAVYFSIRQKPAAGGASAGGTAARQTGAGEADPAGQAVAKPPAGEPAADSGPTGFQGELPSR